MTEIHTELLDKVEGILTLFSETDQQVGKLRLKRQRIYHALQQYLSESEQNSLEELLIYNICSLFDRLDYVVQSSTVGEWFAADSTARVYLNEARSLKKQIAKSVSNAA